MNGHVNVHHVTQVGVFQNICFNIKVVTKKKDKQRGHNFEYWKLFLLIKDIPECQFYNSFGPNNNKTKLWS